MIIHLTLKIYIQVFLFKGSLPQDVIEGRKRKSSPNFLTIRDEFPLRGFLICPQCGKMLTASLSKGRKDHYPYYHCLKGCKERHKADEINQSFENLLKALTTDDGAVMLLTELIILACFPIGWTKGLK